MDMAPARVCEQCVAHDMQLRSRACRARALAKGGVYLGRPGYRPARRMSTRNESAGSVVPGWTFKCQGGTYRRWLGFGISEHETAYGRKSLAELPVLVLQFQRTLLTFFREPSLFLVPADAHDAGEDVGSKARRSRGSRSLQGIDL